LWTVRYGGTEEAGIAAIPALSAASTRAPVFITLNGEPYELDQPLTVADLLATLAIDPRRVAVEHNLEILRRHAFADTLVHEGDRIEIVNFVGGGHLPGRGCDS
jgi:thiamine biosynthesis protein ThiS